MGLGAQDWRAFCADIDGILDRLDIPKSLAEIGVEMDSAERLAGKAMLDAAAGTNPRQSSAAEMQSLIETASSEAR